MSSFKDPSEYIDGKSPFISPTDNPLQSYTTDISADDGLNLGVDSAFGTPSTLPQTRGSSSSLFSRPVTPTQTTTPPQSSTSFIQRLLGPQMQMIPSGFFVPENDYTGTSDTITRKGAHLSVSNRLAKIKFVPGTSGGMQNRIASLYYWQRNLSFTQQGANARVVQTSTPVNVSGQVGNLLNPTLGTPPSFTSVPSLATLNNCSEINSISTQLAALGRGFSSSTDPVTPETLNPVIQEELTKYETLYNSIISNSPYTQEFISGISGENTPSRLRERIMNELPAGSTVADASRLFVSAGSNNSQSLNNNVFNKRGCQVALQGTPTSPAQIASASSIPTTPFIPVAGLPSLVPTTNTTYAPSISAPQNIPWSLGTSTPNPGTIYSANLGSIGTASSSIPTSPGLAVWQFLFNPEEIQSESGPEFTRAETWGVSDEKNSGQPLSWRSNKNRKLTFNRVLLTGYAIGRRVDSLEKGLQNLFMARNGENGIDGPPVLQFVWGDRTFGPCVIQNIRVREQAWDAGNLVNAEVSFELEQVPEWTINDGAVDIARPGRQSLVNDPLLPRSGSQQPDTGAGAGTTPSPQNQPGGGGGQPQAGTSNYNPTLCSAATSSSGNWQKEFDRVGTTYLGNIFAGVSPQGYSDVLNSYKAMYANLSSSEYGQFANNQIVNTIKNCSMSPAGSATGVSPLANTLAIIVGNSNYKRGVQFINGCQGRVKGAIDDWIRSQSSGSGKCVPPATTPATIQSNCQRFTGDPRISTSGQRGGPCSQSELFKSATCGGVTYICQRNSGGGYYSQYSPYIWVPR